MDIGKAKQWGELALKKRELKSLLSDLEKDLTLLEEEILNDYALEGICKITVDLEEGPYNVGTREEIWASAEEGDYDRACDALTKAGLPEFVQRRFNVQTVSAYIRELKATGRELPPEFDGAIKITEKYKLSLTKAGSKVKGAKKAVQEKVSPAAINQFYEEGAE